MIPRNICLESPTGKGRGITTLLGLGISQVGILNATSPSQHLTIWVLSISYEGIMGNFLV